MTMSLHRSSVSTGLGAILVLAGAVVFRLGLMHAAGEFDEFYHLLAARGWLETGVPRILDGEYWRGVLFTRMVAGLFEMTGQQSLFAARLISLAAGSLVPVVLFVWVNRAVGPGTGILAASFAVLWPQGILEAQFARFYAVHVLTFVIGAAAFHRVMFGKRSTRLLFALIAALSWSLALHFQVSSAIGLLGALAGGLLALAVSQHYTLRGWVFISTTLLSLCFFLLVALSTTDILAKAWAFYRWTPGHAAELKNYYGFYFDQYRTQYGLLWIATLGLAPLALRINTGLALYCGTLFSVCFLVHSFGGMKSLRYMSYATPFLFVLWALGLRAAFDILTHHLQPRSTIAAALLAGLVLIVATGFVPRSLTLAEGEGLPPRGDWSDGQSVLGDWIDAPFVATTRELHQIAYIGPYDVLFSPSRVTELDPPVDFGIDPRTGRPVVGNDTAMLRIMQCVPEGVLVTTPYWWEDKGWRDRLWPPLEATRTILSTREDDTVLVVRWEHQDPLPGHCAALVRVLPGIGVQQ